MQPVLSVSHLSASYQKHTVLKDVTFTVEQGDFIGLVGPNGGGKSTLVKTILGIQPKQSGSISLFSVKQDRFQEYHRIGYLPQKQTSINRLFPASVEETVMLGLLSAKQWPKIITPADKHTVRTLLTELGITHLAHKLLSELSGGQQQKVLLARALASKPDLLILDEPSTALDPTSREQFFVYLKQLNTNTKTTVILITHDTGYVGKYANKLLYIDRKLIFFGAIKDFCPSGEISSCFEKSENHIIWHQHG